MNRTLLFTAVLAASGLAGCAAAQGPSDSIIFAHHLHTEQGLGCADCHGELVANEAAGVALLPGKPKCAECHEVAAVESCATCHRNPSAPRPWSSNASEAGAAFSHASHADNTQDCAACHAGADHWPDKAQTPPPRPGHGECKACHATDIDHGKCSLCHERLQMGALASTRTFHEDGFADRHGLKAQGQEAQCQSCHDQAYCGRCHSRTTTVRPSVRFPEEVSSQLIHRGDYVSRHALEARSGTTACLKCHGTQSCQTCHERSGIGAAVGRAAPHPDGWVTAGTTSGHGLAARRDIASCASCHDQGAQSNCVRCHATAAKGGHTSRNPHPPGWSPPVANADRGQHPMCKICH